MDDRIIERQLEEITAIADGAADPEVALTAMVLHHLRSALEDRDHLTTWQEELRSLPPEDAWRLRRVQRLYVEEWVQVVGEIRPDLSEGEARAAVHATLALLHSPTEYKSGLPRDAVTPLLARMALGALRAAGAGSEPPVESV
ncbi:MAG: hypothetical protein QOD57_2749 [Actinomycetota bacterium]|nr:hypothetical protein [Actinomycetota bacterium]MDQ1505022.1 hypothetical protein [Actinomycetota bacterium]